ncbi:MAG: leishmanolysin-related zinc metalloendopeptidase [Gemmatirosa sp.]
MRRRALRGATAFSLLALTLAGCGADPVATGPYTEAAPRSGAVRIVAGDVQVGEGSKELAEPLRVQVVDQSNRPIPNYVVNFRVVSGGGSVFAGAAMTDANGRAADYWTLGPISPDTQRVEVRAVDPATGQRLVYATFRAVAVAANAPVTVGSDTLRIVLTWTRGPQDLDAVLEGPTSEGTRFQIGTGDLGNCSVAPFVCKDRDMTSAPGSETITLVRQLPGSYRYIVFNYLNETSLDPSATKVEVFSGGRLLRTIAPPPVTDRAWIVFQMENGQLTIPQVSTPTTTVASVAVTPSPASMVVGTSQRFAAELRDASGRVLEGRTITWTSSAPAVLTVDGTGAARALAAGTAEITATSEGKSGTATVRVVAGGSRFLSIITENPTSTTVGARAVMRARVTDGTNPVPGATVQWLQEGFLPLVTLTNDAGEAGIVLPTDRAGTFNGRAQLMSGTSTERTVTYAYTVNPVSASSSGYSVDVRFIGNVPTSLRTAATLAAERLSRIITASAGSLTLAGQDMSGCGDWVPTPYSGPVNNHLMFVAVTNIDGPGETLARAGPCLMATRSLAVVSSVQFDLADASMPQSELNSIILHEAVHAVGLGTFDGWTNLLTGAGTSAPLFTGSAANAAWRTLGGSRFQFAGVPVENTGGEGTADGHWREEVLNRELMTGYHDSGTANPLSALTIAALSDLGYQVDASVAEPFVLSGGLALDRIPGQSVPRGRFEVLRRPRKIPDATERLPQLIRRG